MVVEVVPCKLLPGPQVGYLTNTNVLKQSKFNVSKEANLENEKINGMDQFLCKGSVDIPSIASMLRKCGHKSLPEGKLLHGYIVKNGLEDIRFLRNLLMQMYGNCRALEDARVVFDSTHKCNSFSWNIMILVYIHEERLASGILLFNQMPEPDLVTWNTVLAGYIQLGKIEDASHLFQRMPQRDIVSWNAMIAGYGQQGQLSKAIHLFQEMPKRDVISWNTILSAFVLAGQLREAVQLFHQMPKRDVVSWNTIVWAYAQQGQLMEAIRFFEQIPCQDVVSRNIIMLAYAQKGFLNEALQAFQRMSDRDVVSWNIAMSSYIQKGQLNEAIDLFKHMQHHDVASWTIIITAFVQNGHFQQAISLFQKMPGKNVVSWNAMIVSCAQQGYLKDALCLFEEMQQKGMEAKRPTFLTILEACSKKGALLEGKRLHTLLLDCRFKSDGVIQSTIINMYARCGSLRGAIAVFDRIIEKDVVSWTAIIVAHAQHGYGKETLQIFHQMQLGGLSPDKVTLGSVLFACRHENLVDECCHVFPSISQGYGITPTLEHYGCLIHVFGQMGWLDDAIALTNNMLVEPDAALRICLLDSCRPYVDLNQATDIAANVLEMNI